MRRMSFFTHYSKHLFDNRNVIARGEMVDAELERMIEKRRDGRNGRDKANAEAALQKAQDLRRLRAQREENRTLWIAHYHGLVRAHIRLARDARRRARALEGGGG